MEVIVAKSAGFCFGVERAVSRVYEEIERGEKPIYTYGPIIHNEEVVRDLSEKGVVVIEDEASLQALPNGSGTIVIRSHGVSRREEELMRAKGLKVVDATCPFVKKIHRQVEEAQDTGRLVLIAGNPEHPEVMGICGHGAGDAVVIRSPEEIPDNLEGKPLILLSQTTFNAKKFQEIVENLQIRRYDVYVVNTICNATQMRQSETEKISSNVDAMIVIGGATSSNTRKLVEISKAHCRQTYYIQTLVDLVQQGFKPVRSVGITAGASTPNYIIEEVQNYVRREF